MYCSREPEGQSSPGSHEQIEQRRTYLKLVPVFLRSSWVSREPWPRRVGWPNTLRPIFRRLPSVLEMVDILTAAQSASKCRVMVVEEGKLKCDDVPETTWMRSRRAVRWVQPDQSWSL